MHRANAAARLFVRTVLLTVLLTTVMTACSGLSDGVQPSPADVFLERADDLKRGRLLFTGTCGGYCHPTNAGNRDSPYLFDCQWKNGGSDGDLFASISAGIPGSRMPQYGGKLPERDQDIWRLIAYIRSKSECQSP